MSNHFRFIARVDNVDVSIIEAQERPIIQLMIPDPGCPDPQACNFCGWTAYDYYIDEDGNVSVGPAAFAEADCWPDMDMCKYTIDYCDDIYGFEVCGGMQLPEIPNTNGERCGGCMREIESAFGQNTLQMVGGFSIYYPNGYGYEGTWCEICNDPDAINYASQLTGVPNYEISFAQPMTGSLGSYKHSPSMCVYGDCITPENQSLEVCNLYTGDTQNYIHDESKCVYAHPGCRCVSEVNGGNAVPQQGSSCIDCMTNQPNSPLGIGSMNPNGTQYYNEYVTLGACDCDGNSQTVSKNILASNLSSISSFSASSDLASSISVSDIGTTYFQGALGLDEQLDPSVTFCDICLPSVSIVES